MKKDAMGKSHMSKKHGMMKKDDMNTEGPAREEMKR